MDLTGEQEIQVGILAFLSDGQVRTNAQIKAAVERNTRFSVYDRSKANFRDWEAKWHQRVNNALSGARPTSLHSKGYVESCGHGRHRITDAGKIEHNRNVMFGQIVSDVFGDPDTGSPNA